MVNEHIIASHDSRLARLERQNRRLRSCVIILAVCLSGGLLLAAAESGTFGTLTAQGIRIVDKDGKQVISIGIGETGTGISVYHADGTPAAQFGKSNAEQAGGLALFDSEGHGRIGLGMSQDTPSLAIVDTDGHKRVSLGGNQNRYGIVVMDAGEKQRAALGLLDDQPAAFLADENGVPQIGMNKSAASGYQFSMLDKDGRVVNLER